MNFENWFSQLQTWITQYGLSALAAIAIFFIGRWAAMAIRKIIVKLLEKRNIDGTIISFIGSLTYFGILTFVILAVLAKLGVQTASFVAVLGAAGLAIGLALQGSLANFAAGFLLIVLRPFHKGDYIEGAGTGGIVQEIQIFTTTLLTPDNKTVIIPNSKLLHDNIINYTAAPTRKLEIIPSVSYSDDIDHVKRVLYEIASADSRVLKDPPPQIAVKEMAASSVNFVFRVWVNTAQYWDVFFDMTETIKKRFDAEGIRIPFPQQDVHLYQQKSE